MVPGNATNALVYSNRGQFEFLPVTVGVDGAAFSAILRVGAHAGLKAGAEYAFEAGLEVAVVADVVEIVTYITATPDDAVCKLAMSQEYSVALGAAAGATVVVDDAHVWAVRRDLHTNLVYHNHWLVRERSRNDSCLPARPSLHRLWAGETIK